MTRQFFSRTLCAALLAVATCAALPARADTDYSDIWYEGPAASGWGITLSQNDNAIYGTFFVYDVNRPVWFAGTMYRSTDGAYSGTLYVVLQGDFFGHTPFNPALNNFQPAGTMSFTATDPSHGILAYNVGSGYSGTGSIAARTVSIQRQSLVALSVAGQYVGAERYTLSGSGCGSQPTPQAYFDQFVVTQTPTAAGSLNSNLKINFYQQDGTAICAIQGSAVQTGKVMEMSSGSSTCPTGAATAAARVYDLRVDANAGMEFKWTSDVITNCTLDGRINAVRTN